MWSNLWRAKTLLDLNQTDPSKFSCMSRLQLFLDHCLLIILDLLRCVNLIFIFWSNGSNFLVYFVQTHNGSVAIQEVALPHRGLSWQSHPGGWILIVDSSAVDFLTRTPRSYHPLRFQTAACAGFRSLVKSQSALDRSTKFEFGFSFWKHPNLENKVIAQNVLHLIKCTHSHW